MSREGVSRAAAGEPLALRGQQRSWTDDDEEPEEEPGADDHEAHEEDPLEGPALLPVAAGAPDELPRMIDTLGDHQRHEQREQHAEEGDHDAGGDRVGPILDVRADP